MAFKVVPVSKFEAPETGFSVLWACCRDVRRSLSSSPPSFCFQPVSPPLRFWWFRGPAPRGLGPFPAPVPPLPSFVFVPAALLVACHAALVLEVSLVGNVSESSCETDFGGDEFQTGCALWCEVSFPVYVSESSWETAFRGDEFEAGGPLWCEKSFERYVSESSWETAVSGDKFVTGMATWNETDSLNSVWQSPKFNLPGPFHMKEEQNLKALSHQFWKDFYFRFLQASWKVELLIILCNAAVLVAFRMILERKLTKFLGKLKKK